MPTSTDKAPRPQHDRQPPGAPRDEPRDVENQVSDRDRNYNAPFDSDLEPIQDETRAEDDINTHGSDR